MNKSNFWLIRHGETDWNAEKRLQGWRDVALNSKGVQQSYNLAQYLSSSQFSPRMDIIFSSDLSRAYQTAEIATRHWEIPIIQSPRLRERNYGIYEGEQLTITKGKRAGLANFDLRDPNAELKDGENLKVFYTRIKNAFEDIATEYQSKNIMVFAHGGVIDIVWRVSQQLGLDAFRADAIINTSINEFSIDAHKTWSMTNWGQIHHIGESAMGQSVLP